MGSSDDNKATIRRFWEEYWNNGDVAVGRQILAADYAEQDLPWHATAKGIFPDLTFTIDDLLSDGNKVIAIIHWQGTHLGEFNGIAPTEKVVKGRGIWIHQVEDGKILKEHWEVADALGLGQQLNLILGDTASSLKDNSWGH
jgi:predicted ester cyclase